MKHLVNITWAVTPVINYLLRLLITGVTAHLKMPNLGSANRLTRNSGRWGNNSVNSITACNLNSITMQFVCKNWPKCSENTKTIKDHGLLTVGAGFSSTSLFCHDAMSYLF